jgi:hypothetical protein
MLFSITDAIMALSRRGDVRLHILHGLLCMASLLMAPQVAQDDFLQPAEENACRVRHTHSWLLLSVACNSSTRTPDCTWRSSLSHWHAM